MLDEELMRNGLLTISYQLLWIMLELDTRPNDTMFCYNIAATGGINASMIHLMQLMKPISMYE